MTPVQLLATLFAVASVLLDLAVARQLRSAPDSTLVLYLGIACGQLALLSIWCVWGSGPWLLRVLVPIAAAALLSGPLAAETAGERSEWLLMLCLYAALVGVALFVARWRRLCAMPVGVDGGPGKAAGPLGRYQFSLAGLLSLMTIIALVCGLRQHVAFAWQHTQALAFYGACLTWVAIGAVWAMISQRGVGLRVAALAALCIAAGFIMNHVEAARTTWFFTMVALGEAVVICFGLNMWFTATQKSCRSM